MGKPGEVRLCLDARKLNSVTVKDGYPVALIEGILSRLPKARFTMSPDLKDAFWQVPLDEASKDRTASTIQCASNYAATDGQNLLCSLASSSILI